MTCERYQDDIQESIDGTLVEAKAVELARHLETCAGCRALKDDLRAIRIAAGELPRLAPPDRVWARVSAELPQAVAAQAPARDHRWHLRGTWSALAAAAAVVIAMAGSLMFGRSMTNRLDGSSAPRSGATTASLDNELAQSVAAELQQAQEHYEKAIRGLEQIMQSEPSSLDASVAAGLRHNLLVINRAIDESQVALSTQPDSEPAQQSLLEAFKSKTALLQETVALMNETRRNIEQGAARGPSGQPQ